MDGRGSTERAWSQGRALVAAAAAALAYFITAPHLPEVPDADVNRFLAAAVGLAVGAGLVVAAVPLRTRFATLAALLVAGGLVGVALTAVSALGAASPFKALFAAAAGFGLARFIFSPLIVYAVALFVAVVDVASVGAGPTRYLIEEQPRIVEYVTLFLPQWGSGSSPEAGTLGSQLGISDLVFMAVYLDATWRFGLRRRLTVAVLVASFVGSLAMASWLDVAVPALPLLSAGLLASNADIVWSHVREALRQ